MVTSAANHNWPGDVPHLRPPTSRTTNHLLNPPRQDRHDRSPQPRTNRSTVPARPTQVTQALQAKLAHKPTPARSRTAARCRGRQGQGAPPLLAGKGLAYAILRFRHARARPAYLRRVAKYPEPNSALTKAYHRRGGGTRLVSHQLVWLAEGKNRNTTITKTTSSRLTRL